MTEQKFDSIQIGRRLLTFLAEPVPQPVVPGARTTSPAHFPIVHRLAQHTQAQLRVVLDLADDGRLLEGLPNVRAAYECALRASWVSQSREAPAAFANADMRSRRLLAMTMRKAASQTFREGADGLAHINDEELDTAARPHAQSFEQLCRALAPGGADAYTIYRAISMLVHPSIMLVDHYVEPPPPDSEVPVVLRKTACQDLAADWTFLAVASVVWAARAVDVMQDGRPR